MNRSIVVGLCMIGAAFFAHADSTLPAGWTKRSEGALTIYRAPLTSAALEFRLHAPEAHDGNVASWFARRTRIPPAGINVKSFGAARPTRGGEYLAVHNGTRQSDGASMLVVSMGCDAKGGAFRYGELIAPPDSDIFNASAEDAAAMMSSACSAGTPAVAAVDGPATEPVDAKRTLNDKDIALVLFSVEQSYRGMNYVATEYTYLLLRDGSARLGVPGSAPANFDLTADRAQNPRLWGKWKKSGGEYQVKFSNRDFETPSPQIERLPGKKGLRLDKYFSASSGESHGTVGLWQTRGLRFNQDGTFKRSSSSGGGGTAGHGDTAASVYSTQDDKRSQTVTSSPNIGTSTSRRSGVTDADLTGKYEIDGYTLTLKYDNGQIARGFFYISHHGKSIWFEGKQLSNFN
jgi:hypothetical protein